LALQKTRSPFPEETSPAMHHDSLLSQKQEVQFPLLLSLRGPSTWNAFRIPCCNSRSLCRIPHNRVIAGVCHCDITPLDHSINTNIDINPVISSVRDHHFLHCMNPFPVQPSVNVIYKRIMASKPGTHMRTTERVRERQ